MPWKSVDDDTDDDDDNGGDDGDRWKKHLMDFELAEGWEITG